MPANICTSGEGDVPLQEEHPVYNKEEQETQTHKRKRDGELHVFSI